MLGGLGSLTGALLGAALLTFLPNVVTNAGIDAGLGDIRAAELAPLVYGLVMVAVILIAPRGLVGSLETAWHRLRHRRTRTTPDPTTPADAATERAPVATSKGDSR